MNDYITVIKSPHPCNKKVAIDSNGQLSKSPASLVSTGTAKTIYIPDQAALIDTLKQVSEQSDLLLILGFVKGTEPNEGSEIGNDFSILSKAKLAMLLGVSEEKCPTGINYIKGKQFVTRTKANFTQSSWTLLDYDIVPSMPVNMKFSNPTDWWSAMAELVVGLKKAGHIITPSTTSRIMLNGKPAYTDGGWHAYVQVKDALDIERFGHDLLIHAQSTEYGFMRPLISKDSNKVIGHRPWAIADPTTFSPERLIFDGCPIVSGDGLSVATASIKVSEGEKIDTSLLKVTEETATKIKEKTSYTVERVKRKSGYIFMLNNEDDLKLDTKIETENGLMTVSEYWNADHEKLRVQTPFRPDSNSQAAFLGRHNDNSPFLFDVGIQTKFLLNSKEKGKYRLKKAMDWVKDTETDSIEEDWLQHAKDLSTLDQEKLKKTVDHTTNIGIRFLNSELREARKEWDHEKKLEKLESTKKRNLKEGRLTIIWSDDQLNKVIEVVKKRLSEHTTPGALFTHGNCLVKVNYSQPQSVRQIIRKSEQGNSYINQYVISKFTVTTCMTRVLESVSFQAQNKLVGCPQRVAQALIDAPGFALPLSGLLEAPSVMLDGRLLNKKGYDKASGFYCTFDDSLTKNIPLRATKKDAKNALDYIADTVFNDFPFKSDLDKAAAVSFLLTAFTRRFMSKAPGFMVTATVQSSGKSTLADTVFQAAFGRPAAACSWAEKEEEMQKSILSILLEGQSGVCFDNLPAGCDVDGNELAKLITQETYQARLLGKNISATLPTNILVALTGNRLSAVRDMATRLLPINLAPNVENPENIEFNRKNIESWHAENRKQIITSVCTILLAWHQSIDEVKLKPSRFFEWDQAVRKPLLWLGLPDVITLFENNKVADPITEIRTELLQAWYETYADKWVYLKEISDSLQDGFVIVYGKGDELRAVMRLLFPHYRPNSSQLGQTLRHVKDAVYGGLKLEQEEILSKSKASRKWRVVIAI